MITKTFPNGLLRKQPEVARLPMSLLSHPGGGALAFVGHVDRAWSCSFLNAARKEDSGTFSSTLERLLKGSRLGWAMEYFNQAHAALAAELSNLWESQHFLESVDPEGFSELWMAHNDARNFVVLGDPAVKLAGS
jgi:hypothetical protein